MKKPIVAANWKMNKTIKEAEEFLLRLQGESFNFSSLSTIIFPPFLSIFSLNKLLVNNGIYLGAQDLFYEKSGAYTGEISPVQLIDAGCEFILIGHSERRHILKEDNVIIKKKLKAAIENGLKPVLCVGETLKERESGLFFSVLEEQLKSVLSIDLVLNNNNQIIIAYEPVWAIGTGKNATPDEARESHIYIKNFLKEHYSLEKEQIPPVIYGGSIKVENFELLIKEEGIDGGLVGGTSLKEEDFFSLIKIASNYYKD